MSKAKEETKRVQESKDRGLDEVNIVHIGVDLIDEPPWNPNEMVPDQFNNLVKNIRERGFVENVLLSPRKDNPGRFWAISGSHRVKACRVIGRPTVPAVISDDYDEDKEKIDNIRFNIVRGQLDPVKFTKLFNELAPKYGEEITKAMMGFVDKAAFDAVYQIVRENVPAEIRKSLDASRKEIKTIDGLASILNEMFAKYGDTVEKGYMIFSYGGQSHLWIIMDEPMKTFVDSLKRTAMVKGENINAVFRGVVLGDEKPAVGEEE